MNERAETHTPPVGEEIHLPGPSLLPLVMTIGITLIVVGLTSSWFVVGIGTLTFVWSLVRWIKEARDEYRHLPLDHSQDHDH